MQPLMNNFRFLMLASVSLLIALIAGSCSSSAKLTTEPSVGQTFDNVRFYLLDENQPDQIAWRFDQVVLGRNEMTGTITRMSAVDAHEVINLHPDRIEKNRKEEYVLFFLNGNFAQGLNESAHITLPFSRVNRSVVYKYNRQNIIAPYLTGFTTPVGFVILTASTGAGPVIYTEEGDNLNPQGQVYVGAMQPGMERSDWLPLEPLLAVKGAYNLRFVNESQENNHTDLVELLAVDHPEGSRVLFDKYGRAHTLLYPESPVRATDLQGRNVFPLISQEDEKCYTGDQMNTHPRATDGIVLTFRRPENLRAASLVLRAKNSNWLDPMMSVMRDNGGEANLDNQAANPNLPLTVWLETAPDRWEKVDFFHLAGANSMRCDVLPLDLSRVRGDEFRVKLTTGFLFWEIDYVALDAASPMPVQQKVLPMTAAIDQNGHDLRMVLQSNDGTYYEQTAPGDEVRISFTAPAEYPADGMERSFFLHTRGHYTAAPAQASGEPALRRFRQFAQTRALPKYSREQLEKWMKEDMLWKEEAE